MKSAMIDIILFKSNFGLIELGVHRTEMHRGCLFLATGALVVLPGLWVDVLLKLGLLSLLD